LGFFILAWWQLFYVLSLDNGQYPKVEPGWSSLMGVMLIASGIIMILARVSSACMSVIFFRKSNADPSIYKGEEKDDGE
jgi:hypothetical protein